MGLNGVVESSDSTPNGVTTLPDDVRPKLRNDVVFLRVDTGIYLRSPETSCVLKGRGAYEWLAALGPRMTGQWTLAQLCDGLDQSRRGTAVTLIKTLLAKGFVRDMRRPDRELAQPVRDRFAAQVNFVEHFTHGAADGPNELFHRFRTTRVLVLGRDEVADAAVLGLLRNGVAEVMVSAEDRDPAGYAEQLAELAADGAPAAVTAVSGMPADLGEYDVIVGCTGDAELRALTERVLAHSGGPVLLPVLTVGAEAVIGPVCGPPATACWVCAALRLSANRDAQATVGFWRDLALGATGTGQRGAIVQRMIGNALAFETFRLRTGQLTGHDAQYAVVQHLTTLDSRREHVLVHPHCPLPHQAPNEPWAGDPPADEGAAHERVEALVGADLGVLAEWTDETVEQLPVKTGRVRLGGWPAREIAGFDTDVLLVARTRAALTAMATYAGRVGPGAVLSDVDIEAAGLPPVSPAGLDLTVLGDAPVRSWLSAVSLTGGDPVAVPADAVYPYARVDTGRMVEPTSAGSAAGWTDAEVRERGLCSALAYRALTAAIRGSAPALRWSPEWRHEDETAFAIRALTHLGATLTLYRLPEAAPAFAVLAVVELAGDDRVPVWAARGALSLRAAVAAAVLDAVGAAVLRHREGHDADLGDPLVGDFDPRLLAAVPDTDTGTGPDTGPVTTDEVLAGLAAREERAFFVDTTPVDLRSAGPLRTGVVLLST